MAACPVCETDNPLTAVECAGCGKVLRRPTEVPGFAPPIDGLEPTLQAAVDAPDERVPDLEQTALARQIDVVLCPACFARVAAEARCAECGVPLPVRDA